MKKLTLFLVAITMSLFSFAQTQMSGEYTVGTGGTYDYASLADAGMAIKSAEFTGDVTLLICTDLTETINTGIVNKSEYTLTIRPDKDENRTITYTTTLDNTGPTGVFVIGGDMTKTPGSTIGWASVSTKNVIVDGAAEGKTTPRLKITNNKWGTNVLLYGDVQDVIIRNCILVGRSGSSTAYSLAFRSENYSKTSKNIGPKNCVAENCIIESASTQSQVVYCQGNQANSYAGHPTNITIRNCSITSHLRGVFLYGVNGMNIEGCTFNMLETSAGYMCHGILGTTVKGKINVKGNKFIKNTTKNASAGEYGLQTITASGGATLWVIENNYFAGYDAVASGTTTKESRLVGIRCGDPCEVRHNTFYMPKLTHAPGSALVGTHPTALLWLAGSHKYPVQNNIFVCEETTANVSLIRGGLNENVTGNVFYHKGDNAAIVAAAPSCMTFADLETSYPTQAATSKWANVTFADAANGDLSLAGNSNGDETLAVSRLAEVLTDITGKSRREQTYAGAYEGANFPSNMPSSITLTAYPVQDYSASIVGTMKRAIQNGENTIILTHEANGTAHIYNIAHATKTITEISQEGVIAVDPDNAGDYLAISDIAMTEDGKLIASNYMRCEQGTTPATGYKVGEIRYYIWNDITAAPTRWFTTNKTANSTYADVSYTFAIKGTSTNAQLMSTAVHNNNRAARINLHTVVNGTESAYHRFGLHTSASEYTEAKQGTNFQITATPLDNIWALEGELTDPTSFAVPATIGDPYTGTALKNTDLGKKYTGASYLNYDGHYLMVAPYANGEGKLAGVKVLGITLGFDDAISVATSTDLLNAIDATAAAATAYVDGDGDLTIYLIADGKVYTFSEKVYTAQTFTVTANAGEGGTVEGGGPYEENTTATLTATPAAHYDFVNWTEDGAVVSTTAKYSFTVTKDIELTANFQEHAKYTINAHADDNSKGYVTGGAADIYVGTNISLKATAKTGYYFTQWNDGNTDNPRAITVTGDAEYIAEFAQAYPRVYAYNLNVVNNGDDTYTFSFKPNTDAISGNLLLYSEDGTTVAKTVAITTPIVANTVNSITLAKTDLPDQSDVPWAIQLSGNAIPAFAETFADSDLRFARAHAVVDNSPESEYFGRVYVADRRSTKSNSKVYVYNPDFTDLTATNLGLATAGYSRPAVGADGTLYLTGYTDGAEAGIFVVDPADLTKCTQFFNGTYDSDGLYKNNGKEIGSSTSGVGVYGAGKDAVLYTMMEDGSNANFNSGKQPIVKYQIGQENGTVLKQWSDEPTWLVNYPATGKDTYNFGNNDFAATAKGVWVSQNKSNPADRPEIAFVDKTGTIQFMQNSKPSLGGGMTVNANNTVLYIVEDSKILEYAITWNENTPSLTLSNTYPISLQYISTLSVDYAGNLIACAGTTYGTTDNNVMKVVRFTLPTNNNTTIVPAAKAKSLKLGNRYTVTVVINDDSMGEVIGAGLYKEGETAELAAAPAANHRIVNWKNGEDVLSTDLTCSFEVTEDVTINVTFEKIPQYTVTTIASPAGKGSITGGGLYNEGTNVTLTATAHTGYTFVRWEDDDTAEATRTITVTGDITYTAIFDKVAPRAWAYDLRKGEDGANYTFTFKTTSAGTATLIFKDKDGNTLDFGEHTATATTAEEKTITIAKSTFDAATKDIYWEVKMEGAAIENMVEVTDPALEIYDFYSSRGVVVDNDTESEEFGKIYIQQSFNGDTDGKTSRAQTQTAGIFIYDQALNELNPTNAGYKPAMPSGYTAIGNSSEAFKRLVIDPITGNLVFGNNKPGEGSVWSISRDNLTGTPTNLIESVTGIDKVNAICYDNEGSLYVLANINTGYTPYNLYKFTNGVSTELTLENKKIFVDADVAMTSDGRGGLWVAQRRDGITQYSILFHVNVADDKIDFVLETTGDYADWFDGRCFRAGVAYNEKEDVLAIQGVSKISLFNVTYDATTGAPSITKLVQTPAVGENIDGLAFDYAGDLYAVNSTSERFQKFVVPTDDNTCTVPAPESQFIQKETRYTVTVAVNDNAMGTATGGGEFVEGETATLEATPVAHHKFVNWTYGSETSTNNPLELVVEENITVTANFEPVQYTLIAPTNDENKGTVTGAGTYNHGAVATLTATPEAGYKLLYWSDRSTDNPRTITMTKNEAISAYFVKEYAEEPTFKIEKVWENTNVPASTANGYQAAGWDGKIYMKDRLGAAINVYTETGSELYVESDALTAETDFRGDQAIAIDGVGNIIIRSGSGEFFNNPTQVTIYKNGETTGRVIDFTFLATGRCDFISASGDIYSEEGGYVYFYCADKTTVSRLFIKNGGASVADISVDMVEDATLTAGSSQSHVFTNIFGNLMTHTRASVKVLQEVNVVTGAVTTMNLPNFKQSTLGGCSFELGGKELIAYNIAGTDYNSEWNLYNMTDEIFLSETALYAKNTTDKNSAANWLNVEVVDENTAYIYQFCPTVGVAVWKVSIETPKYTRTVTNGDYGTICLPYGSSNYIGAEFYEIAYLELEADGTTPKGIWLDEVTTLEAGKPYIFKATDDELVVYYEGEEELIPVAGKAGLTGTFTNITDESVLEGNYMIAHNKFWLCGTGCWLNANRAYIKHDALHASTTPVSPMPGRRRVYMGGAGENSATGTEDMLVPNKQVQKVIENGQLIIIRDGVKYNVQGVRL